MDAKDFRKRLTELRYLYNVSAREMSLALGQNAGYINNIESGKSLPSMEAFFYICEYLKISPHDFFDTSIKNPEEMLRIIENLNKLNPKTRSSIEFIITDLARKN